MRFRLNVISRIALCAFLVFVFPQGINAESLPPIEFEALESSADSTGSDCASIQLDMTAINTMPVPSGCVDKLCKLVLYMNDVMGAFSDGYLLEVYYYQWSGSNNWIGGPNTTLGGVEFSEGSGTNGNGIGEGIILNGTTPDGGYVRIMDDGDAENDPNLWTIESRATSSFTSASLHVCPISGCTYQGVSENAVINTPSFCTDGLCMILRINYNDFGAFGPGFSTPVFYDQDSASDEWIGGPQISIGGMDFSAGWGENGSGGMTPIFSGGITAGGGYAVLLDDGAEWSASQWSVEFNNGTDMDWVQYGFCPMACTKHYINSHANLDMPYYCLDSLCTIVRWTDAQFGAWGPGLSWPVSYKQKSADNSWIGGPSLCVGGQCFSDGSGINGDTGESIIFGGGSTSPNDGYVWLQDDDVIGGMYSDKWNVEFYPKDSLSVASYYFCSNNCQETVFLINKQYLPLAEK